MSGGSSDVTKFFRELGLPKICDVTNTCTLILMHNKKDEKIFTRPHEWRPRLTLQTLSVVHWFSWSTSFFIFKDFWVFDEKWLIICWERNKARRGSAHTLIAAPRPVGDFPAPEKTLGQATRSGTFWVAPDRDLYRLPKTTRSNLVKPTRKSSDLVERNNFENGEIPKKEKFPLRWPEMARVI